MDTAAVDDAAEGIAAPCVEPGEGLAIGMGKEDDASPLSVTLEGRDDTLALTLDHGAARREFTDHGHVARLVAHRLDGAAEGARRVGNDGLYGRLAARLGANELAQEGNGVFHQIAIRASRRFSSLIRLNVV